MSDPAFPRQLARADQHLARINATNREMVDDAAHLLRKHGDPTKAWAVLGRLMAQKTGATPADPVAFTAIESLAALYIECAQTRTAAEERTLDPSTAKLISWSPPQHQSPDQDEESR